MQGLGAFYFSLDFRDVLEHQREGRASERGDHVAARTKHVRQVQRAWRDSSGAVQTTTSLCMVRFKSTRLLMR